MTMDSQKTRTISFDVSQITLMSNGVVLATVHQIHRIVVGSRAHASAGQVSWNTKDIWVVLAIFDSDSSQEKRV